MRKPNSSQAGRDRNNEVGGEKETKTTYLHAATQPSRRKIGGIMKKTRGGGGVEPPIPQCTRDGPTVQEKKKGVGGGRVHQKNTLI